MEFCELLSNYIDTLGCSVNELSEASNLSPSVISRYKAGKRIPSPDSTQIVCLSNGLATIAQHHNNKDLEKDVILNSFKKALNSNEQNYKLFSKNFSVLCDTLSINVREFSQYASFDLSYIYRIKSGQRKPNDLEAFIDLVCNYIRNYHTTNDDIESLTLLLDIEPTTSLSLEELMHSLKFWILENNTLTDDSDVITEKAIGFLQELNDFNLAEFIKKIHFDDLKIPTVPFRIPTTKTYTGIQEMQRGELDFFKTTVTSRTQKPLYMYSNMPMADMARDLDFGRKWMFGIAASIKKGLTLHVIHDVDRPLDEMFLGMTSWIPIYMTGQVNGYYLKDYTADVFHNLLYVSGACTLSGECIHNHHNDGRYILSSTKEDVEYATRRFQTLMEYATPLMEVYSSNQQDQLKKYTEYVQFHKDAIISLSESPFDNIKVSINPSDWVMIEKKIAPEITFIIKHPKMVNAFEQYVLPSILF